MVVVVHRQHIQVRGLLPSFGTLCSIFWYHGYLTSARRLSGYIQFQSSESCVLKWSVSVATEVHFQLLRGWLRATAIVYVVLGITWTTFTNHSNDFLWLVLGVLLAYGSLGSIVGTVDMLYNFL